MRKSESTFNLTGTQAASADVNTFYLTIYKSTNTLDVGFPGTFGLQVGMADIHTSNFTLCADFAYICHAAKNLYGYLADFCREAYGASAELMDNLLRLDALLADGGRIRPEALDWNRERYQPQTAAFWRGERVQSYLPGFVFTNWRELRGKYHIEIFDWQVLAGTAGEICPGRQAVLFDFTLPEVHCREIELGEDQVHDKVRRRANRSQDAANRAGIGRHQHEAGRVLILVQVNLAAVCGEHLLD